MTSPRSTQPPPATECATWPRHGALAGSIRKPWRAAATRDDVAMTLALDRIADAGPRLLGLIPTKVANAWGPAHDAAFWTLARGPQSDRLARAVAAVASQAWWVLVLGATLFGLYRRARGVRESVLIMSAFLVPLAFGLLVLEAKGRYHEPIVPLLAGVAAIAVTGLRPAADPADPRPASGWCHG